MNEIIRSIKADYLSRSYLPKLVIGTGLSITYGLPGMKKLSQKLNEHFASHHLGERWRSKVAVIEADGLEAALADLEPEDTLIQEIKIVAARYILDEEMYHLSDIYYKKTGFRKLMAYLKDTCSVNNRLIDVMTPNYDRIIEVVCDSLGMPVINGFDGSFVGKFNPTLLKHPSRRFNNRGDCTFVRIYKPHGSLNWISKGEDVFSINDTKVLRKNVDNVEIITPGGSKYRLGMVNNVFRCMRESFNELLDSENDHSLLIYGYGFNDDHFNTVLFGSFGLKPVLIMSRSVSDDIIEKALTTDKVTLFYHNNGVNYLIYKKKKYIIGLALWDMNTFAEVFFG